MFNNMIEDYDGKRSNKDLVQRNNIVVFYFRSAKYDSPTLVTSLKFIYYTAEETYNGVTFLKLLVILLAFVRRED